MQRQTDGFTLTVHYARQGDDATVVMTLADVQSGVTSEGRYTVEEFLTLVAGLNEAALQLVDTFNLAR